MTLTLDLQGQILKMLYLRNLTLEFKGQGHRWGQSSKSQCRYNTLSTHIPFVPCRILKMLYLMNGRADWHGTEGMWVDRMIDPHCDFVLWPHPWPWPLIFKVKFWKSHNSGMGFPIDMERKGCESIGCYTYIVTLNCDLIYDLDPWISRSNFEKVVT